MSGFSVCTWAGTASLDCINTELNQDQIGLKGWMESNQLPQPKPRFGLDVAWFVQPTPPPPTQLTSGCDCANKIRERERESRRCHSNCGPGTRRRRFTFGIHICSYSFCCKAAPSLPLASIILQSLILLVGWHGGIGNPFGLKRWDRDRPRCSSGKQLRK